MSGWPRIILHVDMDAFFASVEVLDNPALRGKPVIVGGPVGRGVVSACSYEARVFGVHSAMPMSTALRLCPHAVVQPVRGSRYGAASRQVMAILAVRTPLMEQVSVDEAYLDMTCWLAAGETPESAARDLQAEVLAVTGLSCSVGVAANKPVAKMASDHRKPAGITIVPPGAEADFLAPLAIGKLRGVGAATEKRLRDMGVRTIGDLARLPESLLAASFGVHGRDLLALAHGLSDSLVVPEHEAKSIGRETTFATDVRDRDILERTLLWLADSVAASLRRHDFLARGITLKLRYDDFRTLTRAHTLAEPADTAEPLYDTALALLRRENPRHPVRLIGITAGPLLRAADRQATLFAEGDTRKRNAARAMDAIRDRFGKDAITRARLAEGRTNGKEPGG